MDAQVAKILSDTEIVLNVGEEQGVSAGQEFLIYEMGEEIIDPETKESLGQLEVQKGKVIIISAQQKVSIAQTDKRTYQKTKLVDPMQAMFGSMAAFGKYQQTVDVTAQDRLKVDSTDSDYSQRLIVRVGDRARRIA